MESDHNRVVSMLAMSLLTLAAVVGTPVFALDDGTPDYIRDFGVLDQEKYERLQRFREVVVVELSSFNGEASSLVVPERTMLIIANSDDVDHQLTFPAASETGMDFDLLSEIIVPGNYWAGEFDTVGDFAFYSTLHPDTTRGVVTVEPRG